MPYANMELFTDLPHFIHNQRSVLFVAHKAITDRNSEISSCPFKGTKSQQRDKPYHIFFVSEETDIKLTK